ncbi:hypothetical protein [Hornefia porci]|nr:hypothetical protein [Hornefia porci]
MDAIQNYGAGRAFRSAGRSISKCGQEQKPLRAGCPESGTTL